MTVPTPEDILSWPQPNYEHPHDPLEPVIHGVNIALIVLMTAFVAGRFSSRIFFTRSMLGLDDWLMLVAYVLAMAISLIQIVETRFGVGRHLYDVQPEWFPKLGKTTIAIQALFGPCCAITKISICLTYLRIFPSRTNKWFNYIQIAILVGFGISTTISMLMQCRPISDSWNVLKPQTEKNCINTEAFFIAVAAMNSGTDFLVYLWPIYYLWNVKLSLMKRIGLIICFGVGVLICIAGIIRITWQVTYAHSWDQPYNGAIIFLIVAIELDLGVVCGCLPGIRPIIRRLFPQWNTSHNTSNRGQSSSNAQVSTQSYKLRKGYRDVNVIHVTNEVELSIRPSKSRNDSRHQEGGLSKGRSDSEEWIFQPV